MYNWSRTAIDGYSIGQLITPQGGDPQAECVHDTLRILSAMTSEMAPNPSAKGITVRYSLARGGPVRLAVFDSGGRCLRVLVDGVLSAGRHQAGWDGMDGAGHRVAAGVYWSRLTTEGYRSSNRMVVLR